MGVRNVKVKRLKQIPPFRKLAMGTWDHPGDPQIYGILEVDLTESDKWLAERPPDAQRVTITHMVVRAVGLAMARYPDLNALIRFSKVYLRQDVDVVCLAAVTHDSGREDLVSVRIANVDQKTTQQIAREMDAKLERLRTRQDTPVQKTSRMISWLPAGMVSPMLRFSSWMSYTLNLRFPGIPRDLFAGCMITNVGMLGLDVAFAPLVPYSRTPLLLLLGQAKKRPVVIEDKDGTERIESRRILTINATVDHRACDGSLLAKMAKVINEVFADPWTHFDGQGAVSVRHSEHG